MVISERKDESKFERWPQESILTFGFIFTSWLFQLLAICTFLSLLNFLIELLCPFFFFDFYFTLISSDIRPVHLCMEQSFEKNLFSFNCKNNREVSIMVRCWGKEIKINSNRSCECRKVFWKRLQHLMKIDTFFFETQKMQHPLKNFEEVP